MRLAGENNMSVRLHDRTDGVSDDLKEYALLQLARLSRHLDIVHDTVVEFDCERKRSHEPLHVVQIIVRPLGHRQSPLIVRETGQDLRATLDLAMKRIDQEITTFKERLKAS
jgi:ribosomal subunit interface protein